MSLHEIMKGQEPVHAVTYSILETKKLESKALDDEIEKYLSSGGSVKQIPVGVVAASNYIASEFGAHNAAAQFDRVRENSRKKCQKASMNSKFYPTNQDSVYHSDANKDKFVVIIGKYISKQFDYIHLAVSHRDFRRKNHAD